MILLPTKRDYGEQTNYYQKKKYARWPKSESLDSANGHLKLYLQIFLRSNRQLIDILTITVCISFNKLEYRNKEKMI